MESNIFVSGCLTLGKELAVRRWSLFHLMMLRDGLQYIYIYNMKNYKALYG